MAEYVSSPSPSAGVPASGVVMALRNTLIYTNTTAKSMFTIPDGAVVLDWVLEVTTAFNDSGTDLIDIGISGTIQKFGAAIDVAATGLKTTNIVAAQIGAVQSGAQAVIATYTGQNANSSAGAMVIMCRYFMP